MVGREVARRGWHLLRGWWLVVAAIAAIGGVAAAGRLYTGAVAAGVLAACGAVAAVALERGRAARSRRQAGRPDLLVSRVDRLTDPLRLGVHPAEAAGRERDRVPPFVDRDRLPELVDAVRAGGFVLVVGDSTAGKSRLAYEAMRRCLPRHTCVAPTGREAVEAAVAEARARRPSVLWLDDLERFLGMNGLTDAALRGLLAGRPGQAVVLATMRTHERDELSARHDPERAPDDRHAARAGREILRAVDHEVRLERRWSAGELARARELAADGRIARALASTDRHGLAELMAAGPQLLQDLRDAALTSTARRTGRAHGDVRGAALVRAAIDARRAGYHRPLTGEVLRALHEAYLPAGARPDTWENALAWATHPLHGTSSLVEPAADGGYLAFDYLLDAAVADPATPPVPDLVWTTLIAAAEPADVVELGWQASFAGRPDQIEAAFARVFAAGDYRAASNLATCLADAGREQRAVALLERTITAAEESGSAPADDLIIMRNRLAWWVGGHVGGYGDAPRALRIIEQVARDSAALHGEHHADTLWTRVSLARHTGEAGSPAEALAIAHATAAAAHEHLGADHHVTTSARFEVAVWTSEVDGPAAGARRFGELLEYARAAQPPDPSLVVDCLWNLGGLLLDGDDPAAARRALEEAATGGARLHGHDHRRTLNYRLTLVDAVGGTDGAAAALEAARQLVADCQRVLGPTHLTTLGGRLAVARWTARSGDEAGATRLYQLIAAEAAASHGEDHWITGEARDPAGPSARRTDAEA